MMTQYIQKGSYEATEFNGEWIILNTDQYTITRLNEVGGTCWSLLAEIQTVDSITKKIMERFGAKEKEEKVKIDVEDFLNTLKECGLIKDVG